MTLPCGSVFLRYPQARTSGWLHNARLTDDDSGLGVEHVDDRVDVLLELADVEGEEIAYDV